MSLFLAFFFFVYSLLHIYAFVKARTAFTFGPFTAGVILFGMAFMVAAPVLIRLAESHASDGSARILGFVGYSWMGLIFLFFCSALALDLLRLILYMLGVLFDTDTARFAPNVKACFYIPFVFTILAAAYGLFEASHIRSKEIVVKTSKIPPQPGTLRIAQISDVHLGLLLRQGRLTAILDEVRRAAPDIVVSTGDLVDGQRTSLKGLDELLKDVRPRYGKFAITGNHEFYSGIRHSLEFTEKAGFAVLRGRAVQAAEWLTIVGVDDPAGPGYTQARAEAEKTLLSKIPRDRFVLFLKHRPSIDPDAVGLFDLQLSGHVHSGQIFPFRLLTRLFYPCVSGYFSLGQRSSLYISKGSGTWGPPIRFLAPPEVTIITLIYERREE